MLRTFCLFLCILDNCLYLLFQFYDLDRFRIFVFGSTLFLFLCVCSQLVIEVYNVFLLVLSRFL